jgi:hypothetical protein
MSASLYFEIKCNVVADKENSASLIEIKHMKFPHLSEYSLQTFFSTSIIPSQ